MLFMPNGAQTDNNNHKTKVTNSKTNDSAAEETLGNSPRDKLQWSRTQQCPLRCKPSRGQKIRLPCLEHKC